MTRASQARVDRRQAKQLISTGRSLLSRTLASMPANDRAFLELALGDRLNEPKMRFTAEPYELYLFDWVTSLDASGCGSVIHLFMPAIKREDFHAHRWDNVSQIISGSYEEIWRPKAPKPDGEIVRHWREGDVIKRDADEGHSLALSPGCPYVLTVFWNGPQIRDTSFRLDRKTGIARWE